MGEAKGVVKMASRSAAVLASGTANAVKLFVAALAFTSAYVGLSAYSSAGSAPAAVKTITLSAREVPVTAELDPVAQPGEVTLAGLAGVCSGPFVARSVLVSPEPGQSVHYGWKLARWSPSAKTWRTYLVDYDGFMGAAETVEWRPEISGDPGWYRVELSAKGVKTVTSDRFQVSC
ncbi:hypothetical protein ACIBQ1_28030 [Nonomuraea sp. NPDC050153]|uniref:hypothetical protein n=1 Tax=Nonomuraea sp. NPDC050153 TaxID=3364359 RepID=UPI0037B31844